MSVSRFDYLERFLGCADFVASGRTFAISDDKWLLNNYDPSFRTVADKHLRSSDARVRADVVRFFTKVRERAVSDAVKEMRVSDKNDAVRTACAGYLDALDENDALLSSLFDILEHRNGDEFGRAASKIGIIGKSSDVPRLRRTYGHVDDEMKEQVRKALVSIIERDGDLKKNRELILSEPIFPNEEKFLVFLDKGIVYIDIRYRDTVAPAAVIAESAYTNVRGAIRKIKARLYNEYDNLGYYGKDARRMYGELLEMTEWAADDLSKKTISGGGTKNDVYCVKCGSETVVFNGERTCIECGTKKKVK
jgi:hypothetical protein